MAIPGTSNQIQVQTPVMALHISHVGYVMPMLDGRTVGFVAILAISGITLTVRACPQLYLTPVKTQLLQYNLIRDLMLFYHSNKIKA